MEQPPVWKARIPEEKSRGIAKKEQPPVWKARIPEEKSEGIAKSGSSSNSQRDDDNAGLPQSLFVVVYYDATRYIRILQLNTQVSIQEAHSTPEPVDQKPYKAIARFNVPTEWPRITWCFSPPTSSTEDLYMLPNLEGRSKDDIGSPLRGYKFNFRDRRTCQPIMPPAASKTFPTLVNRRGHIYFMSHPDFNYETPDPVFECYDPYKNEWKALEPFPVGYAHLQRGYIYATAVWDDTILYSMGHCQLWAYNVPKDRWYEVNVEDDRCNDIKGEAVVLGNTIYALTCLASNPVLALSIKREEFNDEPRYTCSFCSQLLVPVPGMGQSAIEEIETGWRNCQLVHLGEDDFCLVRDSRRKQSIQLICLKLTREKSLTVTNICVYEVENHDGAQFEVKLCFSLPALKEEEGEGEGEGEQEFSCILAFPCPFAVARWNDWDPEPVQENENVALHNDEGHSILVRNLLLDTPFWKIPDGLAKFGPIKKDGIRLRRDKMDTACALVDFESVSSKQDAIESKSVSINERRALIEEY